MSAEYAFDLYPRDDPRDGTRLVRYTYEDLIAAEYRDVIGVGSGQATVWVDHAGVEHVDVRGEQYIRVVRLGGVEAVVGGIWTSKLPFETAVSSERRHLTISGPGQMAYLARARMAPHTYIHDLFIGQDPFDGMWRLFAQGLGNTLGAILYRVIYEAQHFRNTATYTHDHGDGLRYTDSHVDDRLASKIPDLVLGFDNDDDSNGNPWTLESGDFTAQVGENVLGVVQRLMQSGLSLWMDPDDFTLYAWEGRPATKLGRSTDRTGGAWGADVVRFQYPTDGTLTTGNVLSETTRVVNSYLPQGPIWVGGNDIYHLETGPADALYEGFVASSVEDLTALAIIGDAQSTAREEASDVGQVKHRLGDDETDGAYLPGEHYRLDELVRIDTGTGEFDYDEDDYPVGAWRISLPENSAEWVAYADLGASYEEAQRREFAIPATPGQTHLPNPQLCRAIRASDPTFILSGNEAQGAFVIPVGLTDSMLLVFANKSNLDLPFSSTWTVGGTPQSLTAVPGSQIVHSTANPLGWRSAMEAFYLFNPTAGSGTLSGNGWEGYLLLEGVNQFSPFASVVTAEGVDSTSEVSIPTGTGRLYVNGVGVNEPAPAGDAPTPVAGQTQAYALGAPSIEQGGGYGDPTPSWTFTGNRLWVAVGLAVSGTGSGVGDGHADLIGTSIRAKRCDDTEHYHTTADPTVNDDTSLGFRNNTLWINESTGAMFLLLDNANGAADWLPVGGGGADLSGINFLVGTASGDLSAEIVVGTTPGGELGNTWASPTVDATHSGSTHSAATDTHIADAADAHDASAISVLDTGGNFTGTDVEAVLAELATTGVTEEAVRDAGRWEVMMVDGVSSPPDPLQNEDGTDWLYGWVSG